MATVPSSDQTKIVEGSGTVVRNDDASRLTRVDLCLDREDPNNRIVGVKYTSPSA